MIESRFEILKDMFWCAELNDSEFYQLAFEAGVRVEKIADFLAEVREHDGVEA